MFMLFCPERKKPTPAGTTTRPFPLFGKIGACHWFSLYLGASALPGLGQSLPGCADAKGSGKGKRLLNSLFKFYFFLILAIIRTL